MPIRYIDPEKIYDIKINGTNVKAKQIYPQGDFFKMEKCRLSFVRDGEQSHVDDLIALLLKYVLDIDNLPDGFDVKKGLEFMTAGDLLDLSIVLTNKSTFTKDEEKN